MTFKKHEVPEELLASLLADYKKPEDLIGENGLLKQLTKLLVEKALDAELTERRTKRDWALFVESIAARYPQAERITLVMDNLNTHTPAPLYEAASSEDIGAYRSSEDCSGGLRSPTLSLSASTCWRATPKASCSTCTLACHLAASSWC